jgi:hypothetical protein
MGSGAKALLVAGIALSLAVFGGDAALVRHSTGHGQPHPKHLVGCRRNHERTTHPHDNQCRPHNGRRHYPDLPDALPPGLRRGLGHRDHRMKRRRPRQRVPPARTWWPPSLTFSREP